MVYVDRNLDQSQDSNPGDSEKGHRGSQQCELRSAVRFTICQKYTTSQEREASETHRWQVQAS